MKDKPKTPTTFDSEAAHQVKYTPCSICGSAFIFIKNKDVYCTCGLKRSESESYKEAVIETDSFPIYHIRAEPIRPNELLYDSKGQAVAIKSNGKILAIIGGEE